jgi:hypothetical protein
MQAPLEPLQRVSSVNTLIPFSLAGQLALLGVLVLPIRLQEIGLFNDKQYVYDALQAALLKVPPSARHRSWDIFSSH